MSVWSPETSSSNQKLAQGIQTTVAASDSIPTGLRTVDSAVASMQDDPVIGAAYATAQPDTNIPGNILIKTFKPTAAGDATPIAATTFSKKVSWMAFGK